MRCDSILMENLRPQRAPGRALPAGYPFLNEFWEAMSGKEISPLASLKRLKRDGEHYSCLVNHMVGSLDGNPDRPAPTHAQHIACRAKLAGAIRVQYDRVGPHKHILHGRI